jgi:iron uptake system component EfeO
VRPRSLALAAVFAVPALALTGCAADDTAGATGDAITVNATDTACTVSRTTAPAGQVEFTVTNAGSKVNEFYIYAENDRIVGEVENISPGLTRTFHVDLSDPGTYQTACKPGMVGDGIRADFTVTGAAAAGPTSSDAALDGAVAEYQQFVAGQSDAFLERTTEFVGLVKAGKVDEAKALYPLARSHWERIEPVAESFGDLDPRIDGRAEVVDDGMPFTGYHRLEKDLWVDGLQPDSPAVADQLLTDVTELVAKAKAVQLNPLQLANGSKALLDEMATGKITGEEERYSHTDLWDFDANFEGSQAAIEALRPFLKAKNPTLLATIDQRAAALDELIDSHKSGDGFVLYTALTPADLKALTAALDAFSEPVATVAGEVAGK